MLDLKTYCQFCSHKRKTVLLVQSDAELERKKLSKGVCVRVIAFLPMRKVTMMMMMILLTLSNKRSHKTYTSGDKETKRMMIHELKFRTLTSPIVRETMI